MRLGAVAAAGCGVGLGGWIALHQIPDFGPWAADAARSLVGDDTVARAEDFAYAVQDRIKKSAYADEAPQAHWEVDEPELPSISDAIDDASPELLVKSPAGEAAAVVEVKPFRPRDVGPMYPEQAAPGDGRWVAVGDSSIAYKTLIHPDKERSYAELFIAAIDLSRVDVHASAGTLEPENVADGADQLARTGRVPEDHLTQLFAAFNGGFKTRHGGFGMRTSGVTLVPAKPKSCTVARYNDGSVRIGTWTELPDHDSIDWFRQTPACIVEDGARHPSLEDSKSWGATLDGDTVIRRSAVGLSADGRTLFMGISNATHADSLARGMQHVGAVTVAQLDVNYAYPRFLFYEEGTRGEKITPLAKGFVVKPGHYVSDVSKRDFFYLTTKSSPSLARSEAVDPTRGG